MDLFEIRAARSEEAASVAALVDVAYAKYIGRIGRKPAPMQADSLRSLPAESCMSSLVPRGSVLSW